MSSREDGQERCGLVIRLTILLAGSVEIFAVVLQTVFLLVLLIFFTGIVLVVRITIWIVGVRGAVKVGTMGATSMAVFGT